MEKSTDLQKERHRLAVKFNLSESEIEQELVPLMLVVEQSVNKIDQASAKINDSVKPVTYNNNYGHNASAWSMWWGNLATGIAHNIMGVSLVFSGFFLLCISIFALKNYMSDQELIRQAQADHDVLQHFVQDINGDLYLLKEDYTVLESRKGIKLNFKREQP
jgi:hypothetical protein